MHREKNKVFTAIKWLFMIAAYAYLVYKLANIQYWNELKNSFAGVNLKRFLLLMGVLAFMPVNWALEANKWQVLTRNALKLSFKDASKAVLAGLNTGFITPSRFGDFAGRIIYLPENMRFTGIMLTFVNGFIQTLVITIFGLISTYFYSARFKSNLDYSSYLLSVAIISIIFIGVYLLFPSIIKKQKSRSWAVKLQNTLKSFSELKFNTLVVGLIISVVRFGVFCFQYYLMLLFFRVEISPMQAFIGIPTMYLIITYAPKLAASEAAVRASVAVLILGVFSNNEIGILLTGILIWLINFIVPMLVGSVFVVRNNSPK